MIMLVLGAVLIGVAAVLDSFFRIRMQRIGDKWALLYSLYHKARKEQGWAAWPVYVPENQKSGLQEALGERVAFRKKSVVFSSSTR